MIGKEEKELYITRDALNWNAIWELGLRFFQEGCSVWLHDHRPDERCRADGARCRCGRLTDSSGEVTLDLIVRGDNLTIE